MMEGLSVRALVILITAVLTVLGGAAFLQIAGSAVVVDETDGVASAFVVTSDGREQRLTQIWPGYYYAIPQLEGTIEVRCRDGSTREAGYVTGHMHTKVRVVGETPCARLEEVI